MRTLILVALMFVSGGSVAQEPLRPIPAREPIPVREVKESREAAPAVRVSDEAVLPKAVITDPNGQPLPESMPLGEMVVFSFKRSIRGPSAQSMKAIIDPPERASRAFLSDDGLTAYVPTGLKPVVISCTLIVAKGDVPDWTKISIKCGEGPIPPPDPPKPDPPKPDPPKPDPPIHTARHLRLIVIEDSLNRTPATSAILNDRAFWDGLKPKGHSFYIVPENATSVTDSGYVKIAKGSLKIAKLSTGAAYLHLYDDDTGIAIADPVSLPFTDEIRSLIAKHTAK